MKFNFSKYQGTGNDFILIDNRDGTINLTSRQISHLCNRRFGIGADGLMLLENHPELDFRMRYYNSDGNEGTMCGNGGRCMVDYARSLNLFREHTSFQTIDGMHQAIMEPGSMVALQMKEVQEVLKIENHYFVDTGSPHYVIFTRDINTLDVYAEGRKIRESKRFAPQGTNVNFVEIKGDELHVRTYERGVEDETLSCGTGVTAAAICASAGQYTDKNSLDIYTRGGKLNVRFLKKPNNTYTDIWLTGPATFVFKGEYEF